MPNMPKPNPYASSNIKKAGTKKPMSDAKSVGMGSKIKRSMSSGKIKSLLGKLAKGAGAPRGQSPIPYTRLGSGMDMD